MHSQTIIELEKDMLPVIQAMEQRGLNVNLNKLKDLITEITQNKQAIESKLKDVLGLTCVPRATFTTEFGQPLPAVSLNLYQ
ncbi:MAG: hypothetical protein WBE75_00350 [Candidatus Omnitrophota bacterium]